MHKHSSGHTTQHRLRQSSCVLNLARRPLTYFRQLQAPLCVVCVMFVVSWFDGCVTPSTHYPTSQLLLDMKTHAETPNPLVLNKRHRGVKLTNSDSWQVCTSVNVKRRRVFFFFSPTRSPCLLFVSFTCAYYSASRFLAGGCLPDTLWLTKQMYSSRRSRVLRRVMKFIEPSKWPLKWGSMLGRKVRRVSSKQSS